MQIEVKGRQMAITDELRDHVERRFDKIARQVSDLARLDVELSLEPNRALPDRHVAEATLHLKGTVLRASDASRDMTQGQAKPGQAPAPAGGPLGRGAERPRGRAFGRNHPRLLTPAGPPAAGRSGGGPSP